MSNPEKENLNRLFGAFLDADSARQAASDIENGDKLLHAYPAPLPSDGTIAKVKDRVAAELKRRHRTMIQRRFLAAIEITAAVITVAVLSQRFFEDRKENRTTTQIAAVIPDRIWEGSDITADDADFAVLSAEIETVKNTLAGVQINDNYENGDSAVNDLEMELIEINGDIWKG